MTKQNPTDAETHAAHVAVGTNLDYSPTDEVRAQLVAEQLVLDGWDEGSTRRPTASASACSGGSGRRTAAR